MTILQKEIGKERDTMEELKLYDKVLLNSGEVAYITKVCESENAYQANIRTVGGAVNGTIYRKNIVKVYPVPGNDR